MIDFHLFDVRAKVAVLALLCAISSTTTAAALLTNRELIDLNADWSFTATDRYGLEYMETVDVPHSWNAKELWDPLRRHALGTDYTRDKGIYRKSLKIDDRYRGRRLFLRFGAANLVADVSVNGNFLGQHRGGYSAFVFEITEAVRFGEDNEIEVVVDNSLFDDIAPLQGDFNVYGGLIRPVTLIVTALVNITPEDFASAGVYLTQRSVRSDVAEIDVLTKVNNGSPESRTVTIRTSIYAADGSLVQSNNREHFVPVGETVGVVQKFVLTEPNLWNGVKDPYLYSVEVELDLDGISVDRVTQPLGLRNIRVDPKQGLLLNGIPVQVKGVSLHEDWAGVGAALSPVQREIDMEIMREMGANAVRLSHYPHAQHTLDLADRAGMLVWSEIPFVGFPIGPIGGFSNTPEFKANIRQQLQEMIRQKYNHPSVVFWGLYNELPETNDDYLDASDFLPELQALAKQEDPTRLTSSAAYESDTSLPLNNITDVQFWNRYFGWYYGDVNSLGPWLDGAHETLPDRGIGVSEYGSGASIYQQRDELVKPRGVADPVHEENWQAHQHENAWLDIAARDYLVGSFLWVMFDFSSAMRREGDNFGLNNKGLVTYDRRVRKDSFYFYKANWSKEPMIYIAEKRNTYRQSGTTKVKVYSNLNELELWLNGEFLGKRTPDDINRFFWSDVRLKEGNNAVIVKGTGENSHFQDRVVWSYSFQANAMIFLSLLLSERYLIVTLMLLVVLMLYLRAYRFASIPGGTALAKLSFFSTAGILICYCALLVYMWYGRYLESFN